ncbi:ATP-grasp fold amidoligase family protein [Lunatimonas salinarum]|uniref:ATP-grasp fold amidoligase family protein n=1 Tax=Lunatimonas salinarum TaxID=1774590 RepID=UPI001ADEF19A|nr:ATP-grasp fold amidoligase family protein [Lunatimonas salinarum]
MRDLLISLLRWFPDSLYTWTLFLFKHGKLLNLLRPKTFNEKINFIKIYSDNQLRVLVSDRIQVRKFVAEKAPSCSLIPLLWDGVDFSQSIYEMLPQKFVIKGNHGSKMVKIVDKDIHGYKEVSELTTKWLKTDYYVRGRERNYKGLKRYLIVEELLKTDKAAVPPDFKFFCFHGKVEFIQVDLDRFEDHRRNIYNRDFQPLDFELHFPKGGSLEKPKEWRHALAIAEDLSADFPFIRVDLFLVNDHVYFGELTNYPGNGLEKFKPEKFDKFFGDRIEVLF